MANTQLFKHCGPLHYKKVASESVRFIYLTQPTKGVTVLWAVFVINVLLFRLFFVTVLDAKELRKRITNKKVFIFMYTQIIIQHITIMRA